MKFLPGFRMMQINTLVFDRSKETLDKNVVSCPAFSIH